jgi:hypothetical protein
MIAVHRIRAGNPGSEIQKWAWCRYLGFSESESVLFTD